MSSAFNIPAGFALVPLEPTVAMKRAGLAERHDDPFASIYKAMIAAAPTPHVDAVPGEPVVLNLLREAVATIDTLPVSEPVAANQAVGYVTQPIKWKHRQSETVVKVTRDPQLEYGFVHPIYASPSPQDSAPIAPAAPAEPSEPVLVMDDDELQDFCISLSFDQDDYTVDVIRNVERRMLGQPLFQCSVMSNPEMDAAPPSATAQAAPQTTAASAQALGEAGEVEKLQKRALELAAWCNRQSIDCEVGEHWKRQLGAISKALYAIALATQQPAKEKKQ